MLDTDVVVAGLRSPAGASSAIIRAARYRHLSILASATLLIEYEAICKRREHRLAASLEPSDIENFLDTLMAIIVPVEPFFSWRPQLRDPEDEMVLEAAINGKADAIISFNLRDYGSAPERFGIQLLQPSQAIRKLRQ